MGPAAFCVEVGAGVALPAVTSGSAIARDVDLGVCKIGCVSHEPPISPSHHLQVQAHELAKTNERISQGGSKVESLQSGLDGVKSELASTNGALSRLGQRLVVGVWGAGFCQSSPQMSAQGLEQPGALVGGICGNGQGGQAWVVLYRSWCIQR